jgi:hypothetical protein
MKNGRRWITLALLFWPMVVSGQNKALVPGTLTICVKAGSDKDQTITQKDVKLYQNGQEIEITNLVPFQGDQAGLELFILLDESFNTGIGLQLGDLSPFINSLPAMTMVAVGYISHGHVNLVQRLTSDHDHAARFVRPPRGGSIGSSPYSAITNLIRSWPESKQRREILLISTGLDPAQRGIDNPLVDEAIATAQRANVPVSVINLGQGWAGVDLQELAHRIGGDIYAGGSYYPVSFTPYLKEFGDRLQHEYRLSYLAHAGSKDSLQPVKVKVSSHRSKLLAPDHIYVPAVK